MILFPPPVNFDALSLDVTPEANVLEFEIKKEVTIINTDASFIVKRVVIKNNLITKELEINQKEYNDYNDMVNKAPWIRILFRDLQDLNEPKLLFPYYQHIQGLIREKNFDTYSTLLSLIAIEHVNETLIIGLLRLTNPWKSRIASWSDFLEKAHIELTERKHSSEELLRGLS